MAIELQATKRDLIGKKVQEVREGGFIPAILYGSKEEALPIQLSQKEFVKAWKTAGESSVLSLSIDGDTKSVLIYDVDLDPLTHEPRHADFYAVQKGQKVEVAVPLEFTGEAPAVKEKGGNLVKVMHELEVEAEATNLPHEIAVDIGILTNIDQQIVAKDITLPPGVVLITSPDEVVALVAAPQEETDTTPSEVDMSQIGISEDRGKKEEESSESE